MMKQFYLRSSILFTLTMVVTCQFSCDPATDCASASPGDKVPDPSDCRSYYRCTNELEPLPTSESCDDGSYFDETTAECEVGDECETCIGSGNAPLPNSCILDCNQTGITAIPVAGDCNSFYRCNDPSGVLLDSCPEETPYFNGQSCVDDVNQCCYVCLPFCTVEFQKVPDPTDCNSYTFCEEGTDYISIPCDQNEYFDIFDRTCIPEETSCVSYCAADGGSSSASPGVTSTSPFSSQSSSISSSVTPTISSTITTEEPATTTNEPTTTEEPATTTNEPTTTLQPAPTTIDPDKCDEDFVCPVAEGSFTYCDQCIPQYWDCSTGSPVMDQCADGFVFDYTIQQCVAENDCPLFGTVPGAVTEVLQSTSINDCDADFVCPVAEGDFTYCDFCTPTHYSCDTGTPELEDCSNGQVFDYTIQSCIAEESCPTFS